VEKDLLDFYLKRLPVPKTTNLNSRIALVWDDDNAKLCALFSDRVFSLFGNGKIPPEVRFEPHENIRHILVDICQQAVKWEHSNGRVIHFKVQGLYDDRMGTMDELRQMAVSNRVGFTRVLNLQMLGLCKVLNHVGFSSVPSFRDADLFASFLPDGYSDSIEVKIENVGVIDPSNLDWEQVLEIRKDPDSFRKLRRFRLFMTEKHKENNANLIRDDLEQKIDDYQKVCKDHGLDLRDSTISKILDSKSLFGALALSAISLFSGEPVLASASMIGGAAIEMGKIALHVRQEKRQFESKLSNQEIAYLMDVKGKEIRKADNSKFEEETVEEEETDGVVEIVNRSDFLKGHYAPSTIRDFLDWKSRFEK